MIELRTMICHNNIEDKNTTIWYGMQNLDTNLEWQINYDSDAAVVWVWVIVVCKLLKHQESFYTYANHNHINPIYTAHTHTYTHTHSTHTHTHTHAHPAQELGEIRTTISVQYANSQALGRLDSPKLYVTNHCKLSQQTTQWHEHKLTWVSR